MKCIKDWRCQLEDGHLRYCKNIKGKEMRGKHQSPLGTRLEGMIGTLPPEKARWHYLLVQVQELHEAIIGMQDKLEYFTATEADGINSIFQECLFNASGALEKGALKALDVGLAEFTEQLEKLAKE